MKLTGYTGSAGVPNGYRIGPGLPQTQHWHLRQVLLAVVVQIDLNVVMWENRGVKKFSVLLFAGVLGLVYWTFSGEDVLAPVENSEFDRIDEVAVPETQTRVPILMYHYVRGVDKAADPLGWNLSVAPDVFERQMAWLEDHGYVGVHLKDLVDGFVPDHAVVLTFDDGLEDFYTTALPVLQKHGFTASNSIVTDMIGARGHMNEEQIRAIIGVGVEITSHSVGHVDMSAIGEAAARRQLVESKNYLESVFGVDVVGFVYPSGKYNNFAVQILDEEGYKVAVTTAYGKADLTSDNMLLLPRVRVDNRDGFEGFVKKMESL